MPILVDAELKVIAGRGRLLGEQLRELSELNLDFRLEATGFEVSTWARSISDRRSVGADGAGSRRSASVRQLRGAGDPAGRHLAPRSHRIHCGSALDDAAYCILMEENRAAMVFTDPPDDVPIDGHADGLGVIRHREFAMGSGEMEEGQFADFLTQACGLLAHYSLDGALHFICMDWHHMGELLAAGKRAYSELKSLCVWTKANAVMGSLYCNQHELDLRVQHGQGAHQDHVRLSRYRRKRSNVWSYPDLNSFSRTGSEGNFSCT